MLINHHSSAFKNEGPNIFCKIKTADSLFTKNTVEASMDESWKIHFSDQNTKD